MIVHSLMYKLYNKANFLLVGSSLSHILAPFKNPASTPDKGWLIIVLGGLLVVLFYIKTYTDVHV